MDWIGVARATPQQVPALDPGDHIPVVSLRIADLLTLALVAGQPFRGDPDHMADTTTKTQSATIKSIMAGGVWRSRRVIAAVAITAGVAFGAFGASVPQAEATISWCRGCTGKVGVVDPSGVGKASVYTVRHNVYASVN